MSVHLFNVAVVTDTDTTACGFCPTSSRCVNDEPPSTRYWTETLGAAGSREESPTALSTSLIFLPVQPQERGDRECHRGRVKWSQLVANRFFLAGWQEVLGLCRCPTLPIRTAACMLQVARPLPQASCPRCGVWPCILSTAQLYQDEFSE